MKKLLCMFLAAAMLLTVGVFASADSDLETSLADVEIEAPEFRFEENEKTVQDRASLALTTDTVTLSDSGVKVETGEGVCLSYTYPSEDVVCLTQDLQQQSLLYLLFYSENLSSAASDFVSRGMHMNIYDFTTETDIYVYAEVSMLSGLVPNLSVLSESDVLVIQGLLADNYFSTANDVSVGTIGKNLWVFADYGTYAVTLTFVNGVEVACVFQYVDSTGPVPGLKLLENLSVSAA